MTDLSPTTTAVSDFPLRKMGPVALLLILTLAAGWLISGVVEERERRQAETLAGFQSSWGPEQILHGPILVVPYLIRPGAARIYLNIAPQSLKANTMLSPEQRKRGLFHATVYGAHVDLQGKFAIPKIASLGPDARLLWDEAVVVVETSTLSGMTAADHFTWMGANLPWQNCREMIGKEDCYVSSAVVAHIPFGTAPDEGSQFAFAATLTLRGTSAFSQALQGGSIEASVQGGWTTPSFSGSVLPTESTVSEDGFSATWENADFTSPKLWSSYHAVETDTKDPSIAKVELLEATPTYRMINRASKYNILFVVLSFTTYFLFELLTKLRIHALQYGLLGASLTCSPCCWSRSAK
jgi:inner membrane protein